MKKSFVSIIFVALIMLCYNSKAQLPVLTVDAGKKLGSFKPVNGVNGGPIFKIGGYFDNTEYFKMVSPPYVRLHDTRYAAEETVDIHCIFPDFNADENDPANYHFSETDLYIKSIIDIGAKVIYRLGESIEHGEPKRYVNPPEDFNKWARICCYIIRHYNEGWASGFKWDIQYWEIWNEPDNKPRCWTGTVDEFNELYKVAATTIKKQFPNLKVGGPSFGSSLNSKVGKDFLGFCRDNKLPLDFISWHGYVDHPAKLIKRIDESIESLKEFGFEKVETMFNEWNYWKTAQGWLDGTLSYREACRESQLNMISSKGASFLTSVFAYLQDSKLDISCYYGAFGSIFGGYGFFDIYGLPQRNLYAFCAYNKLVQCGTRIAVTGNKQNSGLGITAAVNAKDLTTAVLLSNFNDSTSRFALQLKYLPISNQMYCAEYVIDKNRSLDWEREQVLSSGNLRLVVELPKETVRLLLFTSQPQDKLLVRNPDIYKK